MVAFKYAILKGGKILKFKRHLKSARDEVKELKKKATFPGQYEIFKSVD